MFKVHIDHLLSVYYTTKFATNTVTNQTYGGYTLCVEIVQISNLIHSLIVASPSPPTTNRPWKGRVYGHVTHLNICNKILVTVSYTGIRQLVGREASFERVCDSRPTTLQTQLPLGLETVRAMSAERGICRRRVSVCHTPVLYQDG